MVSLLTKAANARRWPDTHLEREVWDRVSRFEIARSGDDAVLNVNEREDGPRVAEVTRIDRHTVAIRLSGMDFPARGGDVKQAEFAYAARLIMDAAKIGKLLAWAYGTAAPLAPSTCSGNSSCARSRATYTPWLWRYTMGSWWVSTPDWTVWIEVEDGKIVNAAPILRVFIGQPATNLGAWIRKQWSDELIRIERMGDGQRSER